MQNINSIEIGKRIKEARESAKLNRAELAALVQVAPSTITRYEDGSIKKIKVPVISSIANILGVNPMWIIGKNNKRTIADCSSKEAPLTADEELLVQQYRSINNDGKKIVSDYVDLIANSGKYSTNPDEKEAWKFLSIS